MSMPPARVIVRVIGIGSPFGVDRLGWQATELLDAEVSMPVEVRCLDRPGVALIDAMQGAQAVVLIDAMHSGAAAGEIHTLDPARLAIDEARLSSHGLGVAEALALARAMDALPPAMVLIGIEVGSAAGVDELWNAATRRRVRAALTKAIDAVACRARPTAAQ